MSTAKDTPTRSPSLREAEGVRKSRPTPLAALLDEVQSEAARLSGAALTPGAWHAAVGPRIAARTRVGRLVRGTLTIYAATPAWANELSFLADDIITRLNKDGLNIKQVRFQIKDLGPPPLAPHAKRPSSPPARAELPESLKQRLAMVEDPELRAAIAEAAALSLGGPTK